MNVDPLTYGTITGRFLSATGDSDDADLSPDAIAVVGTVTFTPTASQVLVADGSPAPFTLLPIPVVAELDAEGYITYAGERQVRLLATDDPSANPTGWTYAVRFALTAGTQIVSRTSFAMELPAGSSIDLTDVSPVTSSGGVPTIRGERGDVGMASTVAGPQGPQGDSPYDVAVAGGFAGTSQEWLASLEGPQGDRGEIGPAGLTYRGVWLPGPRDYINDDSVFYEGSSWFAAGDPDAGEVPDQYSLHWIPLAIQGAKGDLGPRGFTGVTGASAVEIVDVMPASPIEGVLYIVTGAV
jgi:hypothetical protein